MSCRASEAKWRRPSSDCNWSTHRSVKSGGDNVIGTTTRTTWWRGLRPCQWTLTLAEVAAAEARTGLRSAKARFPCCCCCCDYCVDDGDDYVDGDEDGDTCRAQVDN